MLKFSYNYFPFLSHFFKLKNSKYFYYFTLTCWLLIGHIDTNVMIEQFYSLPDGILQLEAQDLHLLINNHTLIHLEGNNKQPLFFSVLQHGDEHTGWDVIRDYLKEQTEPLTRSISILFGNIEAAKINSRRLEHQSDFNRCWPESELSSNHPTVKTHKEITNIIKALKPFASIDIHNNSGKNPHYSGINKLNSDFIKLASLFSETMIYFTSPKGIQSSAFAEFCPSVTVECGQSGASGGYENTLNFINSLMKLRSFNEIELDKSKQNIYKIFATVKVKENIKFLSENPNSGLELVKNLEDFNFKLTEINSEFGFSQNTNTMPFIVKNVHGEEITNNYFYQNQNKILTKDTFVPAMITSSIKAIRNDCLCYLMQPIS